MKIALVGPTYPFRGGIAHYTTRLAQALGEEGHELLLITFRRQYPAWLFPGSSDRDTSRHILRSVDAKPWLDSLNPLTWRRTAQALAAAAPEMLVLQWWTTFWALIWGILARSVRGNGKTRVVFLCHNVLPHDAKPWERRISRWVLGQGTGWVVHTAAEAARLQALLPGCAPQVAPHPLYDIFPAAPLAQADARRRLGLPVDGPLLLFFGMVRAYKGLDDLLAALPAVLAAHPATRLLVAGDFWGQYETVARRVAELGLQDAVTLHNRYIPNEEVATYFAAADALVAPYRRATGSGVVQTATALGTPVIASDALLGAARPGTADRIVPAQDPSALAAALIEFLHTPRRAEAQPPPAEAVAASWRALTAALVAARGPIQA